MVEVTATEEEVENIVVDQSLLGSIVLSKNGEKIGFLDAIFIDPKEFKVKAIQVNKGLLKYEHYIGRKYIDKLGPDNIILNILPLEDLIGKRVYDSKGKDIGKVINSEKINGTNKLISLLVSPGIGKSNLTISADNIKEVGESILLNVEIRPN
jgi:sporulation protein YlmC with PRC-barrel domain